LLELLSLSGIVDGFGPFVFVGVDEIINKCIKLVTDTQLVFKDDLPKFLP